MQTDFQFFGPLHWSLIAATPAVAWILSRVAVGSASLQQAIRLSLGWLLIASEIAWAYLNWYVEGWVFPERMPLQLCDFSILSTALAALTLRQRIFEFSYYAGIAGAGMAILTPDLYGPIASFRNVNFFIAHCGIVVTILFLIWTGLARPRPGSVWRTLIALNLLGLCVGVYDWVFKTNYMYLREKPVNGSVMDFFGPWPVYLIALEGVALLLFSLLWVPFRGAARRVQA